jgi:antitoxin component of MazEF toxin-antitoxin module
MINVKLTAKKIGNSIGLIIPKDIVKRAKIRDKKKVEIFLNDVENDDMFEKTFGTLKIKKTAEELNKTTNEGELI